VDRASPARKRFFQPIYRFKIKTLREHIQALPVNKLKELAGSPAWLLCALFPGSDCRFSDVEERSKHALTGAIVGPNPHHILCGELRTRIKAERIELTHRDVVHVTGIVQPLSGPMYALEDFAHGT
jgi:hypothetical protein